MTMSPFIIFAIVLTIAYILYYATIITMDLHAKSKKDGEHEETISVGDKTEDDDIVSQTVIENTQTGGFDFLNPNSTIEEMPSEENTEEDTSNEEAQTGIQAAKEVTEEQPDESNDGLVIPDQSDETTEQDDSVEGISQADFLKEGSQNEEENDELFDESQAFDPALAQPQYGVSSIVGGSKDTEIEKRIESVKQKLMEIDTQGGLINPFKFADEMKTEDSRKQSNIEYKDEYTQY